MKKGIELLFESFVNVIKNQKELLLVLAGSGTKEYVKKMKELVKKNGIRKKSNFYRFNYRK